VGARGGYGCPGPQALEAIDTAFATRGPELVQPAQLVAPRTPPAAQPTRHVHRLEDRVGEHASVCVPVLPGSSIVVGIDVRRREPRQLVLVAANVNGARRLVSPPELVYAAHRLLPRSGRAAASPARETVVPRLGRSAGLRTLSASAPSLLATRPETLLDARARLAAHESPPASSPRVSELLCPAEVKRFS